MRKRRPCIAIAVLIITIALMQLPAYANLYPGSIALPGVNNATTSYEHVGNNIALTPEQAALAPTQAQKDAALKIAATSPLCQQYNAYPDESWSVGWTNSAPNAILVSKLLPGDNYLDIIVDLNTGTVVKAEYNHAIGEYASPFSGNTNSNNNFAGNTVATSATPFQLGSLMSFPAGTTAYQPLNMFSAGSASGKSSTVNAPATDMSSVSPTTSSLSEFPAIMPHTLNLISSPGSSDQNALINSQLTSGSTQMVSNNFPNPAEPETTDQGERLQVTHAQKDEALKIAASSPLCKQYNVYPNESWGCEWQSSFPAFSNHNLEVYTPAGTFYGQTLVITVDLNTDSIVKSELSYNAL